MIRILVTVVLVVSVTFLVFSPSLGYEFVNWDDDIYVYDNPKVRSLTPDDIGWWFGNTYYYAYIPLTMISHAIDYSLFGLTPRGHHLTNVVLHSINGGWVLLLGLLLVRSRRANAGERVEQGNEGVLLAGMALAALAYALHPLRAESVAWVSDRKDLLCVFFLLPSTIAYILALGRQDTGKGRTWLLVSFLLFVFALLSKPVVIGFPLVLLTLDWYLSRGPEWRERWKSYLAGKGWFFAASVVVGIVLLTISSGGKRAYVVEQLDGLEVILFPFYSFMFYLWKTILPTSLSPIYPAIDAEPLVAGLVVIVGVTAGCIWMARKGKNAPLASWIVYVIFLLPTVIGLSSGMQPIADRFSYLSTIGFFLVLGGLVSGFLAGSNGARRIIGVLLLIVLVTGLGWAAMSQSSLWRSSETLWRYVVGGFPARKDYIDAYVNLGAVYADRMELPEAEGVLTTAVKIDSMNADAFYNLGHVLYLRGEWEKAAGYFERTTTIDSGYVRAYYNYAVVTSQLGRDSVAIPAMRRAARLGMQEAVEALRQSGIPAEEGTGTLGME